MKYVLVQGSKDSSLGTDVGDLGDRFRPSTGEGDLTIVNVQLEDEQWYWCEASSKVDTVVSKSYFEVQGVYKAFLNLY